MLKNIHRAISKRSFQFSDNYYGHFQNQKFTIPNQLESSKEFVYLNELRKNGHHFSTYDPLKIFKNDNQFPNINEFGLTNETKMTNTIYQLDKFDHFKQLNIQSFEEFEPLLRNIYSGKVGVEFEHIQNKEERDWLYQNYEIKMIQQLSKSEKYNIHQQLVQTEAFDHFLEKKFNTFKRYSGEGIESQIVFLKNLIQKASEKGITDCVMGIAHRGRMNVLVNILEYPPKDLFYKISGKNDIPEEIYNWQDDVPHHISSSNKLMCRSASGKENPIQVSIVHNPSHLEAVNPVTMGKCRAKLDDYDSQNQVLNVQMHGDAAFNGQGVVFESFVLGKVPKYQVGGSIHLMVNNQIGYTTMPLDQRPTKYSTELCKSFDVPIIHVNADDVESVYKLAELAIEFRQKFKKDIMIDLIGYRKFGHNELDEPGFTQPKMYNQIRKNQKSCPQLYHQKLVEEVSFDDKKYDGIRNNIFDHLEKQFNESKKIEKTIDGYKSDSQKGSKSLTKKWKDLDFSCLSYQNINTGIEIDRLKELGLASITTPEQFQIHPRINKFHIQGRQQQIQNQKVDWATAEAMAMMSLLQDGFNVRISGQDVERGTFSQRHCVLTDQNDESKYNLFDRYKGRFQACNSPLSEYSVLGYEFGYGLESPQNLVIWEAQFGDFFNTAQVIYDTFITCSEAKWLRQNSLMTFLPHGYDGAGPEHSSSRIERFLQMGSTDGINSQFQQNLNQDRKKLQIQDKHFYGDHADINFQFVQPTTPANFFHLIRRQMLRNYRKPIVVASAKTLLKNNSALSELSSMGPDTKFQEVLEYGNNNAKIYICSGKFQYELTNIVRENGKVLVIEELLPFPEQILKQKLSSINQNSEVYWVQEEPINCGAYTFAMPHIQRILKDLGMNQEIQYCGRKAGASTATGDSNSFRVEKQDLINSIKSTL